jgi:hypothetical protein
MPYVQGAGAQKDSVNPAVEDVFHSENVYANFVPIALFRDPQGPEAFVLSSISAPTYPAETVTQEVLEGETEDPQAVDTVQRDLVRAGVINQSELDLGANAGENPANSDTTTITATTGTTTGTVVVSSTVDDTLLYNSSLTNTEYYVKTVTKKPGVIFPYDVATVAPQNGIEVQEVCDNLRLLIINCIDPIRNEYSDTVITCSFRAAGRGSPTSQHPRGMACDIQYSKISKAEYYQRALWIRDNIAFDQFILEYKTTGTGLPWHHISFNKAGNRGLVYTFMNNKNCKGPGIQGLFDLSNT